VEAHGTATPVGDPVELAALTQAFRTRTAKNAFCALGSVKSNVGHLDTAAGVAGLIKAALALQHRQIPPTLHFERPNPKIDFEKSPFYVNTSLAEWPAGVTPRRAGVSSFGIGGTNAHVVVEEAPAIQSHVSPRPWQLLLLSAKSGNALEAASEKLAAALAKPDPPNLADVAHTLRVGRKAFSRRRFVVAESVEDAVGVLSSRDQKRMISATASDKQPHISFLFTGQGSQYAGMGAELYQQEPFFREQVDLCSEMLKQHLQFDLRTVLYPVSEKREWAEMELCQTRTTQPALFVTQYALAKLWMSWGVIPQS